MQLNVNVFLRSFIQVVFTFGFMVYINTRLALVCSAIVPGIVIASHIFAQFMRKLSKRTQDSLAKANGHAEEVRSAAARRLAPPL